VRLKEVVPCPCSQSGYVEKDRRHKYGTLNPSFLYHTTRHPDRREFNSEEGSSNLLYSWENSVSMVPSLKSLTW
jgi:hypothetical protein